MLTMNLYLSRHEGCLSEVLNWTFGAAGQHVSLLQLVYLYQHYSYMCSHQSYMCMAIGAYECIHIDAVA